MKIIQDIGISEDEILRIQEKTFQNVDYVDIRIYYRIKNEPGFYPSKKGITINKIVFNELRESLNLIEV